MHREADGGQINWHNESLRRHGHLESPVEQGSIKQLLGTAKENTYVTPSTLSSDRKVKEAAGAGKKPLTCFSECEL